MCNLIKLLFGKKNKNNKNTAEVKETSVIQSGNVRAERSVVTYERKNYMTVNESIFYKKLTRIFGDKYIVAAQVPLSSAVRKKSDARFQSELYRIVDFALVDRNTMEIKVLIELNDKSHFEKDRQYRDFRVKEICEEAKIPLLTFWTHFDNEESYIKSRIEKTVNEVYKSA